MLEVKAGHALSLQYHRRKHEILFFRRGTRWLQLGEATLRIELGTVHHIEAETDLEILEVSTPASAWTRLPAVDPHSAAREKDQ